MGREAEAWEGEGEAGELRVKHGKGGWGMERGWWGMGREGEAWEEEGEAWEEEGEVWEGESGFSIDF